MNSMSDFRSISRAAGFNLPRPSRIDSDLSNATSRSKLVRSCVVTKVRPLPPPAEHIGTRRRGDSGLARALAHSAQELSFDTRFFDQPSIQLRGSTSSWQEFLGIEISLSKSRLSEQRSELISCHHVDALALIRPPRPAPRLAALRARPAVTPLPALRAGLPRKGGGGRRARIFGGGIIDDGKLNLPQSLDLIP